MKRGRPVLIAENTRYTRTVWQRARQYGLDHRSETPFGALAVQQYFTDFELRAADKIIEVYDEHFKHFGLSRSAASPSFEVGIGRSPIFEDDAARERAETAKRNFDRLQKEISPLSRHCQFALDELVIQGRACPPLSLPQVKQALDYLADRLGYKPRKKRLDISKRPVN